MSLSRKFSLAILVVALGSGVTACDKRDEGSAGGTDSTSPGATTEPGAGGTMPDSGAPGTGTGGATGTEPPPASGTEGGTGTGTPPGSTTPPPADNPAGSTGTGTGGSGSDSTR